jgi:hypothetical protein
MYACNWPIVWASVAMIVFTRSPIETTDYFGGRHNGKMPNPVLGHEKHACRDAMLWRYRVHQRSHDFAHRRVF